MCGAIGEPSGRVIDWDRIERFVVTTRVDGGTQSQSVGKEAVTAVLTDGYRVERFQEPSLEEYPPGNVPQQWSRDYLKQIIRDTIREYGLVPNNYSQVEHGPVGGMSEKAGDATDDLSRVEYGIGVKPPVPQRDATDGESRPPTPESKWSPDRLVQEVVGWYSVVRGVTLSDDYRRELEMHLSRVQQGD